METYFNIRYEFDHERVAELINDRLAEGRPGYICVADGVILNHANSDASYLRVVNGSMFSICDSSYVPIYLRCIYGIRRQQYCGSQIFMDIIRKRKYNMCFMGTSARTLEGLRANLVKTDPRIADMMFYDLPYRAVDDFDYADIAARVEASGADIVWVALGAPKQEIFMSKLQPHLRRGVMIAVGAAFKFYSGLDERRAPAWMVRHHMEFLFRIVSEPKKQLRRCGRIVASLPRLLFEEWQRKRRNKLQLAQ